MGTPVPFMPSGFAPGFMANPFLGFGFLPPIPQASVPTANPAPAISPKTEAAPANDSGNVVPAWVHQMLKTGFFSPCEAHAKCKKNECTYFCTTCTGNGVKAQGLCQHCVGDHAGHTLVQIRRYVYCDVVRAVDMSPYVDTAGVQTYIINQAKVMFLNHRPQSKVGPAASPDTCRTCHRHLREGAAYCSLACKVQALEAGETWGEGEGAAAAAAAGADASASPSTSTLAGACSAAASPRTPSAAAAAPKSARSASPPAPKLPVSGSKRPAAAMAAASCVATAAEGGDAAALVRAAKRASTGSQESSHAAMLALSAAGAHALVAAAAAGLSCSGSDSGEDEACATGGRCASPSSGAAERSPEPTAAALAAAAVGTSSMAWADRRPSVASLDSACEETTTLSAAAVTSASSSRRKQGAPRKSPML